jgi:DNA-binding HxlR family transcriptional regulator
MLTARLKLLVDEDILQLQPASDGSAWQEYVLTAKGRTLQTVLVALSQWGNDHLFAEGEHGTVLVDARSRQPLQKLQLLAEDGRVLQPDEIAPRYPDKSKS